jgi:hypothetical protein
MVSRGTSRRSSRIITPQIRDYGNWWKGIGQAGGEFYFHHAVFELIDNSISYCLSPGGHNRPTNPTIEVSLVQGADHHDLFVHDNGSGINYDVFSDVILNPGGRPPNPGMLSEHGFGLKNALSYIQDGHLEPFKIISKSEHGIWKITGPYGSRMKLEESQESEWNENLFSDRLLDRQTGTTIWTKVSNSKLRTVLSGSFRSQGNVRVFEQLVDRLREHVMITYRKILKNDSSLRIFIFHKQGNDEPKNGNEFYIRDDDQSIRVWEHIPHPLGTKQKDFNIPLGLDDANNPITAKAKIWLNRALKERVEGERFRQIGEYSKLKYYYPLKDAKVGIDVFVRNRLVRPMEWDNVYPEIQKNVSYNNIIGELELDNHFSTRNNKTNVNIDTAIWRQLIEEINGYPELKPDPRQNERDHQRVLDIFVEEVESHFSSEIIRKFKETTQVFDDAIIDFWYELADSPQNKIHIIELKASETDALDVYQLKMYCDGLIHKERITDKKIILELIGLTHTNSTKECCKFIKNDPNLKNANGEKYNIVLKEYIPQVEEGALRRIRINVVPYD